MGSVAFVRAIGLHKGNTLNSKPFSEGALSSGASFSGISSSKDYKDLTQSFTTTNNHVCKQSSGSYFYYLFCYVPDYISPLNKTSHTKPSPVRYWTEHMISFTCGPRRKQTPRWAEQKVTRLDRYSFWGLPQASVNKPSPYSFRRGLFWFGMVLCHINHSRLFKAKSIYIYIYINSSISNDSV